jgi:hypothetical protein
MPNVDFTAFNTELQALADKYQVEIKGTASPVAPDQDDFDILATPASK